MQLKALRYTFGENKSDIFLEKEETLIEKRRRFVRRFSVSSGTDVLSENVSQPTFQDRKRERESNCIYQLRLLTTLVFIFTL